MNKNKCNVTKIGEFEVVDEMDDFDIYDYEEIPLGALFEKSNISEEEKKEIVRKQFSINIHMMLCEETYEDCLQVIEDAKTDPRLANLNAIVYLMLKPKNRGKGFTKLSSLEKYKALVDLAFKEKVNIGFDSCSANSFLRSIKDHKDYTKIEELVEPCESTLFSIYIDVDGNLVPCSFCPGENNWETGINMLEVKDFLNEVWNGERLSNFRTHLIQNKKEGAICRCCPVYDLELN